MVTVGYVRIATRAKGERDVLAGELRVIQVLDCPGAALLAGIFEMAIFKIVIGHVRTAIGIERQRDCPIRDTIIDLGFPPKRWRSSQEGWLRCDPQPDPYREFQDFRCIASAHFVSSLAVL